MKNMRYNRMSKIRFQETRLRKNTVRPCRRVQQYVSIINSHIMLYGSHAVCDLYWAFARSNLVSSVPRTGHNRLLTRRVSRQKDRYESAWTDCEIADTFKVPGWNIIIPFPPATGPSRSFPRASGRNVKTLLFRSRAPKRNIVMARLRV